MKKWEQGCGACRNSAKCEYSGSIIFPVCFEPIQCKPLSIYHYHSGKVYFLWWHEGQTIEMVGFFNKISNLDGYDIGTHG